METPSKPSLPSDWPEQQVASIEVPSDWRPDADRGLRLLRERRAKASLIRKTTILTTVFAASLLGAATLPQAKAFAGRCAAACIAGTELVSRFVLDKVRSAPTDARDNRQQAPDFSLTDQTGRTVQLSAYRGNVVLLNFWATWCNPCRAETPWFNELQAAYRDRGLRVLGVALDEEGWEAVRPFVDEFKIRYPVMIGGDPIIKLYGGLDSLPTTLILDKAGRIAATHIGLVSKARYEQDIVTVLHEQ